MPLKTVTVNKSSLLLILIILASFNWYLGTLSVEKKMIEIPNLITESITCLTNSSTNNQKFTVFITDRPMAEKLLDTLCHTNAVNRQYGEVEIRWSNNEQEISQYVGKGLADLALVKDNVMQAFATQSTHSYKMIAQYQDYAAYFFSLKDKPQLSKQYLWGKKLGLLDYPSSRSGHIVPKSLLNELGIAENNMQITYVKSHEALRDLLAAGKVDLISTFWQEQDTERFSLNYITPLETKVSGSKWYLKMATDNTDLLCDVQTALHQLSNEIHSQYYSQLNLTPLNCTIKDMTSEVQQDEK
jgi:phosphonate transport system substrate-binding protein